MAVLDPSVLPAVVAQATTTTAPTTTAPGPVIDLDGPEAVALVVAVGAAFAILWAVPFWLDARRAYRLRERAIDLIGGDLLNAARRNGLSVTELRELLGTIGEPATGQKGLARGLMALTIITIVGVALIALLLGGSDDVGDLRKTVLTSLLTLLGTIVGFYFGTRAAESAATAAGPEEGRPPSGPAAPPSTSTTPETAAEAAAATPTAEEAAAAAPTAEEAAAAPAGEEEAAVADEAPEDQLEAGLGELSPEEVAALEEQVAAEHGRPEAAEIEDPPLDEDDVLPLEAEDDPEDGPESKQGGG